jgi:NAD(P)-dependent dehydrogenase (short-subunit alcohol dehydrogenase family)
MPGRMRDKVVVITGAAQGIGRGCAELLARVAARVVNGDSQVEAGDGLLNNVGW